jgi:hypothetical protein
MNAAIAAKENNSVWVETKESIALGFYRYKAYLQTNPSPASQLFGSTSIKG